MNDSKKVGNLEIILVYLKKIKHIIDSLIIKIFIK
jgi:hypothetical protein